MAALEGLFAQPDPFEWGDGPSMSDAEARHHGTDGGAHHRPLDARQALLRVTEFTVAFPDWDEDGS